MLTNIIQDQKDLDTLLTPSWLSGFVTVVASLLVVFGSLGLLYFKTKDFQLLTVLQASDSTGAHSQAISDNFSSSSLVSDVPLFIFWAGVGVVAYAFTIAIINALQSAAFMQEELGYLHADRQKLLRYAAERLGVRLVALVAWFVYLNYTVHRLVPYAMAVAYAGTTESNWLKGGVLIFGSTLMLIIVFHLHTILLRLIALRPRLFGVS
jgi:L-cystine uptake protein TcyP (sodium:dicarboxylate symporter family)